MILFLTDHLYVDDEDASEPFQGAQARIINALKDASGIDKDSIETKWVLPFRPHMDNVERVLTRSKTAKSLFPSYKKIFKCPKVLEHYVEEARTTISDAKPRAIVTFGPFALWSLTGDSDLRKRHGFIHRFSGIPVIPTYHPSSIIRNYAFFMPAACDIARAVGLAEGKVIPEQFRFIEEPSLTDIKTFRDEVLASTTTPISIDIETKPRYRSVASIGVGTRDFSICIQFWNKSKPGQSYWRSQAEELQALALTREILSSPNPKILQNAMYDLSALALTLGLRINGPVTDTRLQHIALYYEFPHHLAEIASGHLAMEPWKADHDARKG